jgi:gas vesicle protein
MNIPAIVDRVLVAAAAFVAGVSIGLLIAPAPGGDTRGKIASTARNAASVASEQAHELADPLAERAREAARHLSERHIPLKDEFEVVDPAVLREEISSGLPGAG